MKKFQRVGISLLITALSATAISSVAIIPSLINQINKEKTTSSLNYAQQDASIYFLSGGNASAWNYSTANWQSAPVKSWNDWNSGQTTEQTNDILSTVTTYLTSAGRWTDIDKNLFLTDIKIGEVTKVSDTEFTFSILPNAAAYKYVVNQKITGMHCVYTYLYTGLVPVNSIITPQKGEPIEFNKGFVNGTLPNQVLTKTQMLSELARRSKLGPTEDGALPGLNANQLAILGGTSAGIWNSENDAYDVEVAPISGSTCYTSGVNALFSYNVYRPEFAGISGMDFEINDTFITTPTKANIISRFRTQNSTTSEEQAFWTAFDSGIIRIEYSDVAYVANSGVATMEITSIEGSEDYTVTSPITITCDVKVKKNLSSAIVQLPTNVTADTVLQLPATFSHEDWFYTKPNASDITTWLQGCSWQDWKTWNSAIEIPNGVSPTIPFNNNFRNSFAWEEIEYTIVDTQVTTMPYAWTVTISAKNGSVNYFGNSLTCVITQAV